MWKYRVVYIAVILAAGAVYIATNQRQLFMMLIALVAVPIISLGMLLISTRKIHIGCELQDACVIYQKIGMNIKSIYKGIFPIGKIRLQAKYENMLFETEEDQIIVLESGADKELYYEMPYVSEDCGRMKMHFSKAVAYDVMGLFAKNIKMKETHDFTIFPEIVDMQVSMVNLPNAKNLGDHYDQNKRGQDVTEVFSMREYQDGDSPRSIHWKLSSKLDKLIVREFSHPSNYDTLVLYDTIFSKKHERYHEVVNGVLGITASISKSLMNQNHVHHVGCMSKTEFVETRVEDNSTYMQALINMMSTTLDMEDEEVLDDFLKRDAAQEYTKIVLVTSDFDEWNVENGPNYDVITRSIDSLTTKAWILEI